MLRYALRRVLSSLPVLFGILVATFFLVRLTGDPTDVILPPDTTAEARAAFRAEQGLDQPMAIQFIQFARRAVLGDFGMSPRFSQPAMRLVVDRAGATAELASTAIIIAVLAGVPLGVLAARRPNGRLDLAIRGATLFGQAIPSFYLGVLAVLVFALWLRWLPTGGRDGWSSLVLPAVTLALNLVALIARVTRSSMVEAFRQDYIRTARAKGLTEFQVAARHALRNAFIPVFTVIGLEFGVLLGGVVVTETVFSWPGMGRLAIQAIYARDFPVVQAVVFVSAVTFVVINLVVDLVYAALDPRISYQ